MSHEPGDGGLEASLKKLLLERPLDKITVTDIAEDCGINRMTFYYHFRDIYDLVEWACQEDARRILDGKRTYTTWQEGFRRILDGLIDNRPFILNVYRSVRREQVETFLFQVTHGLLMGVVEELDPRGEVREEDKAFLADFYKYAFVGLVLDWIRTGMKGEPAELARRVEPVVSGLALPRRYQRLRADSAHQAGPFDQKIETGPGDEASITGALLLIRRRSEGYT
ncbi:MAG: TetR/AcrR family transcriptional regulator [Flavonifractor plautii]